MNFSTVQWDVFMPALCSPGVLRCLSAQTVRLRPVNIQQNTTTQRSVQGPFPLWNHAFYNPSIKICWLLMQIYCRSLGINLDVFTSGSFGQSLFPFIEKRNVLVLVHFMTEEFLNRCNVFIISSYKLYRKFFMKVSSGSPTCAASRQHLNWNVKKFIILFIDELIIRADHVCQTYGSCAKSGLCNVLVGLSEKYLNVLALAHQSVKDWVSVASHFS